MVKTSGSQNLKLRRRILMVAVALVLLMFCSVPIAIILYGGAAMGMFGMFLIGGVILLQLPVLLLLKRLKWMPGVNRSDSNHS